MDGWLQVQSWMEARQCYTGINRTWLKPLLLLLSYIVIIYYRNFTVQQKHKRRTQ